MELIPALSHSSALGGRENSGVSVSGPRNSLSWLIHSSSDVKGEAQIIAGSVKVK